MLMMKTKYQNLLELRNSMRLALSNMTPSIQKLIEKKQEQVSH